MDIKSQYAGLAIKEPQKDKELIKQFNDFVAKKEKTVCPMCSGKLKYRFTLNYYKCDECDKVFTD